MTIFKACDIRAPYGSELKDEHAAALGQALATVKEPGPILVGGDAHLSTPAWHQHLVRGLRRAGCHVVDLETVSIPPFLLQSRTVGDHDRGDDHRLPQSASL